MTWHNLPCAPTLAALSEACPHGWAEIRFTYHGGQSTADPPQDADCSIEVGRLWGVENNDEPALVDLLDDLREPPLGIPSVDFTLLARMVHRVGPCNTCGRVRAAGDDGWFCWPDWEAPAPEPDTRCVGAFIFETFLEACWGPESKPVYFVGETLAYGLAVAGNPKAVLTIERDG